MAARKIFLVCFGSRGDLVPLLAVGQRFQRQGCEVSVVAGPGLADLVACSGLSLLPICTEQEHRASLSEVPLLGSKYAARFFHRHVIAWNTALLNYLAGLDAAETLCIASERPTIWGDLCANAHFGIPCVRLAVDPPAGSGEQKLVENSRQHRRLEMNWLAAWRRSASRFGISAGWHHPQRLVRATCRTVPRFALWPDWFASCRGLTNLRKFGFVGDALELRKPTAPVAWPGADLVFVVGSLGTEAEWSLRFSRVAAEACLRLGRTGLILGCARPKEMPGSPPGITWERFLPLGRALQGAQLLVHHGGIGTIATALKAGLPQLSVPRVFGQCLNSAHAVRLGVARELAAEKFDPLRLCHELALLLSEPSYGANARALGARMDSERSLAELVQAIGVHWRSAESSASPSSKMVRRSDRRAA